MRASSGSRQRVVRTSKAYEDDEKGAETRQQTQQDQARRAREDISFVQQHCCHLGRSVVGGQRSELNSRQNCRRVDDDDDEQEEHEHVR